MQVYQGNEETQVIILSAYSEFEYARAALRYNAWSVFFEAICSEELPQAVEKAILNLKRYYEEIEEGEKSEEGRNEIENLYEKMQRYISRNYCRKITLDEIAEELHANRSYLSRLYKSKKGANVF